MNSKVTFGTLLLVVLNNNAGLGAPSGYEDFQSIGLNDHNYFRGLHGSPMMSLNLNLNQIAQDCAVLYATQQAIDHSCSTEGVGENLYSTTASMYLGDVVQAATRAWYEEVSLYNFDNPSSSDWSSTGHFTQMVWKSSTDLGIGAATVNGYTVVVGKYSPFGNVQDDDMGYYRANVQRA